ncbi:DNA-binding transcriptional regulator, LysR family [Malonomonas rubra DSM 5091]|uniref:DNA-binding transcriptional regulator, LysR family n=1 Tax=Malonomonas rubra DSM 5091 TaxID=1122189 RepID=A0A1M6EWK7_MALRU|nr:LysR family transcriptional regulator [Malonomonas rubra]SHI89761.1 DNA-binding transcriptional regulator, LysR family [Malonomonas rubra DSM 5091]
MELYRLKSFLAIAKAKNLTRAAEQQHISQSALSSQLKQLEEELELSLFERSARGMHLSAPGRELLPYIDAVLEAEKHLLQKAHALSHGEGETLHIGLNADPGFLRAGLINRRMLQLYSEMNIVYLTSPSSRAAQLLRQGQLDLAFVYGVPAEADVSSILLDDIRFCVVIPTGLNPQRQTLDWSDIAALPWIWVEQGSLPYDTLQQEFSRLQLAPQQMVKTVDEYIVKELVLDGQGVAIMREDEARPMVDAGQVQIWQKGWLTLPLSLAWATRAEDKFQVRSAREVIGYLWQSARNPDREGDGFNY